MSQPHILVVDDDPEIGRLLGKYLESQGFRCTIAASRRACEQKIADARIDLVVSHADTTVLGKAQVRIRLG